MALIIGLAAAIATPVLSTAESFGQIPEEALLPSGDIDYSLVPDFVVAWGPDGSAVGYVAADDILPINGQEPPTGPIPVVNQSKHLVGHMVPGVGYVAIGETSPVGVTRTTVTMAP